MENKRENKGENKSRVHIYCGDGKGKTTAAMGLAARAAGRGFKVLIAQFLKTDDSGEVEALKHIPGIDLVSCQKNFGFFFQMTEKEKAEAGEYYTGLLSESLERSGDYDMLVLDEIMAVSNLGLVKEETVRHFLENRPAGLEVVLTGRDPSAELVELADYVSEIKKIKHPFDGGTQARKGIEF